MSGFRKTALAASAMVMVALAVPAQAGWTPVRTEIIRDDIEALEHAIDKADRKDRISEREAANLRARVHGARRLRALRRVGRRSLRAGVHLRDPLHDPRRGRTLRGVRRGRLRRGGRVRAALRDAGSPGVLRRARRRRV